MKAHEYTEIGGYKVKYIQHMTCCAGSCPDIQNSFTISGDKETLLRIIGEKIEQYKRQAVMKSDETDGLHA